MAAKMDQQRILDFQNKIQDFYRHNKRDFAWRRDITPYRVFVSEVMLQQTQTARVAVKFEQWLARFDSFESVAAAASHDILAVWQGLGYNRRGLALYKASQIIVEKYAGKVPQTLDELESLPGIGPNTAGAILAYAYNMPVVFIETNIRTIFLHEFFPGQQGVHDKEILALVQATLDHSNPRDWYYALMDYGVYLKKELKANNKASRHYTRQSTFVGSRRQVRGSIVRILTRMKSLSHDDLVELVRQDIPENEHSIERVVAQLIREQVVREQGDKVCL